MFVGEAGDAEVVGPHEESNTVIVEVHRDILRIIGTVDLVV